jgi:hypothetical protein
MPWVVGPTAFAAVIVPVIVPEVADGASRLVIAAAQEYHDATSHLGRCKVQVGHEEIR